MRKYLVLILLLMLPQGALAALSRVVTLSPHLTEMAFAAGITPVGVSDYSDYPAQAATLPKVANWQGINVERIIALKPDVVLAWRGGNLQRQVEQLQKLGLHIVWLNTDSLTGLTDALKQLANWSPQPERAIQQADALTQAFAALEKRYHRDKPLAVFLQFGTQPLFTAASHTLQNQILTLCGGRNIFADSRVPWPQVSREQVLVRQPQAIVTIGDQPRINAVKAFWYPQLDVPIIALNDSWFSRPGPRMLLAAKQLCQALTSR